MRKLLIQIPGEKIFQGTRVSSRVFHLLTLVSPVTRP